MPTLRELVNDRVREGDLYEKLDRNRVRCFACGHCCPIPEGQPGVCKVRFNRRRHPLCPLGIRRRRAMRPHREEAVLPRLPRSTRLQLRHARLRSPLLLLPELGDLASAPRPASDLGTARSLARSRWCATRCSRERKCLVSTYNEPLITAEWAVAIFKEAKAAGLVTGFVSNGNGTPQVLEYLRPWRRPLQSGSEEFR